MNTFIFYNINELNDYFTIIGRFFFTNIIISRPRFLANTLLYIFGKSTLLALVC